MLQTHETVRDIATVKRRYKKVMKALINTVKYSGYYVISTLPLTESAFPSLRVHEVCMILGINSNYLAKDRYTLN